MRAHITWDTNFLNLSSLPQPECPPPGWIQQQLRAACPANASPDVVLAAFQSFFSPDRRGSVAYHTLYGILFLMQMGASIFPKPHPSNLLQGFIQHLLGDVRQWSDQLKDLIERPAADSTELIAFLTGSPITPVCPSF